MHGKGEDHLIEKHLEEEKNPSDIRRGVTPENTYIFLRLGIRTSLLVNSKTRQKTTSDISAGI